MPSDRRACTECGEVIDHPRKGQYQHDGKCHRKAVRGVARIVGPKLARRIFATELELLAPEEAPEPHRHRQRKVLLNATVPGAAVDTREGE